MEVEVTDLLASMYSFMGMEAWCLSSTLGSGIDEPNTSTFSLLGEAGVRRRRRRAGEG